MEAPEGSRSEDVPTGRSAGTEDAGSAEEEGSRPDRVAPGVRENAPSAPDFPEAARSGAAFSAAVGSEREAERSCGPAEAGEAAVRAPDTTSRSAPGGADLATDGQRVRLPRRLRRRCFDTTAAWSAGDGRPASGGSSPCLPKFSSPRRWRGLVPRATSCVFTLTPLYQRFDV